VSTVRSSTLPLNFIIDKLDVYFEGITGKVLSTEKRTEVHLDAKAKAGSSSSGSSSIGENNIWNKSEASANASIQVTSRNLLHHEIWLQTSDGREKHLKLTGVDIPLRQGQTATFYSLGSISQGTFVYYSLVNSDDNTIILPLGDYLAYRAKNGNMLSKLIFNTPNWLYVVLLVIYVVPLILLLVFRFYLSQTVIPAEVQKAISHFMTFEQNEANQFSIAESQKIAELTSAAQPRS
jgi:hypothetical protein